MITNALTLNPGTAITFGTDPTAYGDYRLIGYGSLTGSLSDLDLPGAPPNTMYTLSTTVDPSYIDLVVAVPEPSTLVRAGNCCHRPAGLGMAATKTDGVAALRLLVSGWLEIHREPPPRPLFRVIFCQIIDMQSRIQ